MKPTGILIVDDETNIRLMLRTALESEHYDLWEAGNGREALDAIAAHAPDLVLLDLSMPVMDGMTLLERVHDMPADRRPRVVVLTAYGSIPAAVKAVRLGASDFLEKPVTPDDLRLSVAAVLEEPADPRVGRAGPDLDYGEALQQVREDLFAGDVRHAEALLMRAAELAGTDPAYFNLLGVLHEAEGRRHLAKKFYGKAIKADPRYTPAQQNMRRLYELQTFGGTKLGVALGNEAALLDAAGGTGTGPSDSRLRKLLGDDNGKHR